MRAAGDGRGRGTRAVGRRDARVSALTRAALVALLVAPAPVAAAPFVLVRTVVEPEPAGDDFFGCALAADADGIVAGARFADAGAPDAGRAFVFDGDGALRAVLQAPAPAAGAQLGAAVARAGDAVAIGAPRADAVDVFDAASGVHRRRIAAPAPVADALFGFALAAAAGAEVVVGAPFASAGAEASGAAYRVDVATGVTVATYAAPAPGAYDLFGNAVAAVGTLVAVGAPLADVRAANSGAVHVFAADGTFVRTLVSPRGGRGDLFGTALANAAGVLAVGAPYDDTAAADAGAVYLFDAASGAPLATLLDPAPQTDARFGSALAALGGQVLVGAPLADLDAVDAGVAYLFDATTGALVETFRNPTPAPGDQFGGALAGAWPVVAIGAWLDDAAAANAGAFHLFRDTAAPPTSTTTSTSTTTTTITTATPPSATTTTATTTTTPGDTTTTATGSAPTTAPAATSTSSVAPTSSTTTTSGGATTTTTAPPPGPGACDDGDPCTTDVVADGACVQLPLGGLDGVLCRLGTVDALLHVSPVEALGGAKMARRLERATARAWRLVDAARAGGRDGRIRARRARRALGRFVALVVRAERSGRMLRALAERLRGQASDAAAQLALATP
jgi:hypothetical protein